MGEIHGRRVKETILALCCAGAPSESGVTHIRFEFQHLAAGVFPIPPTVANVNSFFTLILLLPPLAPLGRKLRHAIILATFHSPPFDNLAATCSPNFQVLAARGGLASQCSYHHSHSMLAVMLLEEWVSICYDIKGLTGLAHQLSLCLTRWKLHFSFFYEPRVRDLAIERMVYISCNIGFPYSFSVRSLISWSLYVRDPLP